MRFAFCSLVVAHVAFALGVSAIAAPPAVADTSRAVHTFSIGPDAFVLDGKPLQIRCGEIHLARVPREYWADRLHRAKAMGLNAVCAYLFWNFHEGQPGKFDWQGQADAAEFCRLAQAEGLWVILRPGPYACAEWEMGGLPWWLLKDDGIKLRSRDPRFLAASDAWLREVGRVLGPRQISRGGPILMVQVENEYGSYGKDAAYLAEVAASLRRAGFDVPLFACNPVDEVGSPAPAGVFKVVNFGKDPQGAFAALRATQPSGPLMCGEFYPGWFDTWGAPHHTGNTAQYLADLEYMLSHGESFSIYMAHGGTTFGLWSGADRPFKPDTSSYDYDAPIAEDGACGQKFEATRALMAKYLQPGETLPPLPAAPATMDVPAFTLSEAAPLFDNLPEPRRDAHPRTMEAYDQGRGAILYRTTLPAGVAGELVFPDVHDFAFVYLDGNRADIFDRRQPHSRMTLPARTAPVRLDILVYALGRINFGAEVHDHKGLLGDVALAGPDGATRALGDWQVYSLPLDDGQRPTMWHPAEGKTAAPGFWRGSFDLDRVQDTFLDLSHWGFGVVWVNGHVLGRFWNIGPTQTAYIPAPWLRRGRNEVRIFDLIGPTEPTLSGRSRPVLNELRPQLDFTRVEAKP